MSDLEIPKRLAPTMPVLRELFLKSGNLCAYPGCSHLITDPGGEFIAQICHIEAAERGGERFNKDQNNEQRRAFSNLVLLCHKHHVITNNVDEYPVERLAKIKADHEEKVNHFASTLQLKVVDLTRQMEFRPTLLPRGIAKALGWPVLSDDELVETARGMNDFGNNLHQLPLPDSCFRSQFSARGMVSWNPCILCPMRLRWHVA
jgi:hypothetical protein